jgi:molybdate transport system substrate-binding protein
MRRPWPAWVGAALLIAACGTGPVEGQPGASSITVAAASDLRLAFEELGKLFTDETGIEVVLSFGSSGQLKEQIANGAPFDLFASANVAFVDDVIAAGRGLADTKADYAYGRIVIITGGGAPVPADVAGLADPAYRRIAIANPDHAPYGVAAMQALEAAGIPNRVGDRLVFGENVSDTLRIVESGNADAGIVALSLAITGTQPYYLIPADLHAPLRQALVVTTAGPDEEAARRFVSFISGPAGREIMNRYGFILPGEAAS